MKFPFPQYHLFCMLNEFQGQRLPLDLFMSFYFRKHKAIGSKDKAFISESAYALVRWQGLLDTVAARNDWPFRLKQLSSPDFETLQRAPQLAPHDRASFPEAIYIRLLEEYGPERTDQLCWVSNHKAPTTVRANLLKTSRQTLLDRWEDAHETIACETAPAGIHFLKKINFYTLSEFKEGLFEVQDEASQLLASLVDAAPKDKVLDYCAGAGGKSLAIAPVLQSTGQIFLHDIRPHALMDAKKRLKRAGIQNAQIVFHHEASKLKRLKKNMDWVLLDVPCSGSGTYRRNPDMKWKFKEDEFQKLLQLQRQLFERGLSFVKPSGKIVYTTCSLFQEENEKQLGFFLKHFPVALEKPFFKSLPQIGGMDGMFGAVLRKI